MNALTTFPDIAAAERIAKFLHLDALPVSRLTAEDKVWLERYLSDLFAGQMIVFRASVENGDTESQRKSYFQSDYEALKRAYDIEQGVECRVCNEVLSDEEIAKQDRDEHVYNFICDSCSGTLNRQQALDHFADGKR